MSSRSPVLFIPHGGGPLPLLGHAGHKDMVQFLGAIAGRFVKPAAILVISAHWEEKLPTVTGSGMPSLLYDYYGFPEESYEIQYPVRGCVELAEKIHHMLQEQGIPAQVNEKRGLDHGVFVPLKIMYPEAGIPCVQLSLVAGLDPRTHIEMGKALSELRNENILVIGSGFSFHNLKALMSGGRGNKDEGNDVFQQWLIDTCVDPTVPEYRREENLVQWSDAPFARYCHPREEHLLPLHVCYGMCAGPAITVFDGLILGKRAVAFLWD